MTTESQNTSARGETTGVGTGDNVRLSGERVMQLWEAYERDGPGCAMYLYKIDAEACESFENGCDRIALSHVRVSDKDLETLYARKPIFA